MRANKLGEFFPDRFPRRLEACQGFPDLFELVKDAVQEREGVSRSGLMLGLAELGGSGSFVLCGLHPLHSNIILLNKAALRMVRSTRPEVMKPFVFHVLMHEYLHTIGLAGERAARLKVLEICQPLFGAEHVVTRMAQDIREFLPFASYPARMPLPEGTSIELVEGFDRSSASYFA
jgi:hypothetical protein